MADRTIDAYVKHGGRAVTQPPDSEAGEPVVESGAEGIADFRGPIGSHECLAGGMVWRRAFPGRVEQASRARFLVRCLLEDTRWNDDAEFVTAELVNNALLHTRSGGSGGYFVVELIRGPESVRVGVYDLGGGGTPNVTGSIEEIEPGSADVTGASDLSSSSGGSQDVQVGADWELPEDGRGLVTVRRLVSRVGCEGDPATGHLVWALFTGAV
ncbi:ATP-binding protein [Sphaerisporangium corydalis]|uniref:ATP-binding protein n=1 Tax=Sphaerisporangium corydalis TaxID=1441875 RepID=A0ABV9ESS2_9ACTN|nr:ATP-binding protein [Sphaerisporangium corydalis]